MSRLGCLFWLWSYRSFFVYSFSRKIKILYKLWYLLTAPQSSVCLFSQNIFRSGNVLFTFIDGRGDLWWAGCRFLSIILHLVVYSFICTPFMKMSHGNKSIIAFNMQLQSHRKSVMEWVLGPTPLAGMRQWPACPLDFSMVLKPALVLAD